MNHPPTAFRRALSVASLGLLVPFALTPPAHAAPAADDQGCDVSVTSDFDGDSDTDAVIADPAATVDGHPKAGRLIVLYGGNGTFEVGEGGGRAVITQNSAGVGGSAENGDQFGSALSAGDLNCDGYTDLVVGTPYEDNGRHQDSGLVQVIWGSISGLGHGLPSSDYDQTDFHAGVHQGDRFGFAVDAVEDAEFDGTPGGFGLAIGVPGWDVGARTDAGAAALISPYDGDMVRNLITQDSPGIAGAAEKGDQFGTSIALTALFAEQRFVVAVGAPGEDVGKAVDAGSLTLLRQFDDHGPEQGTALNQNSLGAPGKPEAHDRFGSSVDVVADGGPYARVHIAAGAPGEDVGSIVDAGAVQVFSDEEGVLGSVGAITQDTPGVSGKAERGDRFGEVLTFGASVGSSDLLMVGVPHEDGAAKDTGVVQLIEPDDPGHGDLSYSQDSPGVPGVAAAGDRFGATVAKVVGEEELYVVGVPDDVAHSSGMVDAIPAPGEGAPRAWVPGAGNIPAAGAHRFGAAVLSAGS